MAVEGVKPLTWGQANVNIISGNRLHLNHGPIDLIIKAEGQSIDVKTAYVAAVDRFQTVLIELVEELPQLRQPIGKSRPELHGTIAKRMVQACWPYRYSFITPMAAVAGSVADEIRAIMLAASPMLHMFYVNNGGDIAVFVSPGAELKIGLVADLAKALPEGVIRVDHHSGIGGIATSGWRGRSFSRGIADAVTVIAPSASEADAAATMIANSVDITSNSIKRSPARDLDPDSDLGEILVTTAVGPLKLGEIDMALELGVAPALKLLKNKNILGCFLALQKECRIIDKNMAAEASASVVQIKKSELEMPIKLG